MSDSKDQDQPATPPPPGSGPAGAAPPPPPGAAPEWVDSAVPPPEESKDEPTESIPGLGTRLLRVLGLDPRAYEGLAEEDASLGLMVAGVTVIASALGGWAYLVSDDFGPLPTGRILFREVAIGAILAFGSWLVWLLIAEWWLARAGHEIDRMRLFAAAGIASLPFALCLLMGIPILAFGSGLLALVWWNAATVEALASVAPGAERREVAFANLLGFTVFAMVLGAIAWRTGMAPGPFTFVGVWELLR